MPTLEDDGKVVYESLIVCDYLDDIYPHPRLTPVDPFQKALDAMFLDYFNNMVRWTNYSGLVFVILVNQLNIYYLCKYTQC